MKNLFLFTSLLFFTSVCLAQERNNFIGLSLGPSIPIGDFASSDFDNDEAGLAMPGLLLDISFRHQFNDKNFGLAILLRGQANAIDVETIENEFEDLFPGTRVKADPGAWAIGGFLFGGFGRIDISEKVAINTRGMIGFLNAASPELDLTITGQGGSGWVKTDAAAAYAFTVLLGTGFSFDLGERLQIITNLDYLGANPEFKNVETTSSLGDRQTDTWSQSISTINLSAGIAFKL